MILSNLQRWCSETVIWTCFSYCATTLLKSSKIRLLQVVSVWTFQSISGRWGLHRENVPFLLRLQFSSRISSAFKGNRPPSSLRNFGFRRLFFLFFIKNFRFMVLCSLSSLSSTNGEIFVANIMTDHLVGSLAATVTATMPCDQQRPESVAIPNRLHLLLPHVHWFIVIDINMTRYR